MRPNKQVHVIGGGTFSYIRNHLALAAPAFGQTARRFAQMYRQYDQTMDVQLHLTKMADPYDPNNHLVTNVDVFALVKQLVADLTTKIIFFNPAIVDFDAQIGDIPSGKNAERLQTSRGIADAILIPGPKIVQYIRSQGFDGNPPRKDIMLIATKATAGATPQEQYRQGLRVLKQSSANLVLANDTVSRNNMIIVPEEAVYHETTDRDEVLQGLVEMAYLRSQLTFTRSTVVAGDPVPWESDWVPAVLRAVVDYCIERGAYKKFLGVTAGHFAVKIDDTTFLTSRRKTDFNDMKKVGLVQVRTDGPDTVIAYGSRPSVGGQSQRIVFVDHPGMDCIVHFHCPIKPGSEVPVASQREYECGSHQCGQNTSSNLKQFGNLKAVYLAQHGPNIVFGKDIDPQEVINFIEENFDLTAKTGKYSIAVE